MKRSVGASNRYITGKAEKTARALSVSHNIDPALALSMTGRLWEEARRCILSAAGEEGWKRLSFSEKAGICQAVVRGLLDRGNLIRFLSGKKKSLT